MPAHKKYGYSDEELKNAIDNSNSIRQALQKLNVIASGGNYRVIYRKIKILKINISHLSGQGHLKGKTHNWARKTPLNQILVKDSTYGGSGNKIKRKLFEAGIFEKICYCCESSIWLGEPIPLELEHKNGDRFDNRIENLTLLCPNCHALTKTYRGKNKKLRACG